MSFTQPRIKWPRDLLRNTFYQPSDPQPLQQEIHHFPDNVRKSFKLNRHRIRSTVSHKSKQKESKSIDEIAKKIDEQLTANINICKFFNNEAEISPQKQMVNMVPIRPIDQFLTTADRMQSIRRRLSPVKRTKCESRIRSSVDSVRQGPVQRITFLNIQKLQLIKIYSDAERKVDSTRGTQSLEERYNIVPARIIRKELQRQFDNKLLDDKQLKDIVISLKKTLKEGNSMKWNCKPKTKPFLPPFQRYFYKDFIWKVAFSNGLILSNLSQEAKVKVFVGKGNNSQLVRSIIKRRSWWSFTQKWQDANLVWTQLKINSYFNLQQTSEPIAKSKRSTLEANLSERNSCNLKVMNENDLMVWDKYFRENRSIQDKLTEDMMKRNFAFRKLGHDQLSLKNLRMQNHLSQNFVIGNKKALLYTMRQYYESNGMNVFDNLPLSFHIVKGIQDSQYARFLSYYYQRKKKAKKEGTSNVWIVKPGELTNRGNGIIVCLTLDQIKSILKKGGRHHDGSAKTFILQEYIQKPFLYQKRKFDIRHYMLITSINGHFKGYWFQRGYIRTSSAQYTLQHGQACVHLTNDAVQKWLPDYGRYQKGNKVSYQDFQLYLEKEYSNKYNFFEEIYPKMKKIAADVIKACARTIDPKNLQHNFQLFGMDFMIDGNFKPWLIEVNTNPCLQLSCPLLTSIIPDLIQNTLKICVDSVVGPPINFTQKRPRFNDNALSLNEFQLVYDSMVDEMQWRGANCLSNKLNIAELDREQDEQFQDDGVALQD